MTEDALVHIKPVSDWVLVDIYDDGTFISDGYESIIRLDDSSFGTSSPFDTVDHAHPGIRPRWALVLSVNEKGAQVGLKAGQKVLLDKLKWTRPFTYEKNGVRNKVWAIRHTDVLGVDDTGFTPTETKVLKQRYGDALEV